jgi:hypothetical protein
MNSITAWAITDGGVLAAPSHFHRRRLAFAVAGPCHGRKAAATAVAAVRPEVKILAERLVPEVSPQPCDDILPASTCRTSSRSSGEQWFPPMPRLVQSTSRAGQLLRGCFYFSTYLDGYRFAERKLIHSHRTGPVIGADHYREDKKRRLGTDSLSPRSIRSFRDRGKMPDAGNHAGRGDGESAH